MKTCKKWKYWFFGVALGAALIGGAWRMDAQAEKVSDRYFIGMMAQSKPWEPGIMALDDEDSYLPELKDGNYERWIDRVKLSEDALRFYDLLGEAADNDGVNDFLVDMKSSSLVKEIKIWEWDENGDAAEVSARGIKIGDIRGVAADVDQAFSAAQDEFFKMYYEMCSVYAAFTRDFAEIFWLQDSCYFSTTGDSIYTDLQGNYVYANELYFILESDGNQWSIWHDKYKDAAVVRETIEKVDENAEEILAGVNPGMEDSEKIAYFNEWLTTHNEYNHRIGYGKDDIWTVLYSYPDAFECTAALEGLTGDYGPVCESYARAMKVLCDRSGIPCVLVDGYAGDGESGGNHMWNYVEVDGAWYAVDVTWNDPLGGEEGAVSGYENEDYLLVGSDTVIGTLKFIVSHPVGNVVFTDGVSFINGPVLCKDGYTATIESLRVSLTADSVTYGYTELPVLTAEAVKAEGQTGDPVFSWYEVREDGSEVRVDGANSNVFVFPEGKQGGRTYTYRVKAALGNCTKSKDVQIKVTGFEDVWTQDFFYHPVVWAVGKGITDGWSETAFAPDMTCTRGQLVTFLWRANGCPAPETTEAGFTDVPSYEYYAEPVAWAVENEITDGWTETTFEPNLTVTRGQVVTFLWRAEGKPGKGESEKTGVFSDVSEGEYFYDAVYWAVENGITDGWTEDTYEPYMGCTRGQIVTFLYRTDKV
ncbi:MAG: S-layer homology domain-containing protein [Lachnospiraceae bacterium]